MENKRIGDLISEVVFDKFVLNFAPGLILYYAVKFLANFSEGEGLTSFLIIAVGAWTLGALVEMLFFNKSSVLRRSSSTFTITHKLNLLLGKIGVCILVACLFNIIAAAIYDEFHLQHFHGTEERERMDFELEMIKCAIFSAIGLTFLLIFKRRNLQQTN